MFSLVAVILACVAGQLDQGALAVGGPGYISNDTGAGEPVRPGSDRQPGTDADRHSAIYRGDRAPVLRPLKVSGLMLATSALRVAHSLFREQCRFPQALLLLPAGAVLIFLLNSFRDSGPDFDRKRRRRTDCGCGFHSRAGWIVFNLIAVGFTATLGRVPWLSNAKNEQSAASSVENPAAAWLMPFVMILAAGMLSACVDRRFRMALPSAVFRGGGNSSVFQTEIQHSGFKDRLVWAGHRRCRLLAVAWP